MESEEELLKSILIKYSKQNIIISTKLLFERNLEIMKKLKIKDFYELFDKIDILFEKNNFNLHIESRFISPYNKKMEIGRPQILFGKISKYFQESNFLESHENNTRLEIVDLYKDKYGFEFGCYLKPRNSNILKNYDHLIKKEIMKDLIEKYHENNNQLPSIYEINYSTTLPNKSYLSKYFKTYSINKIWDETLKYEQFLKNQPPEKININKIIQIKNILLKYSKKNIIISTKILFHENLEIMKKYEIKDFYELFHFIAKHFEKNNFNLTIIPVNKTYLFYKPEIKSPEILFGKITHKQQIENFINTKKFTSRTEFRDSYIRKYGYFNKLANSICKEHNIYSKASIYSKEIISSKLLEAYHKNNNHKLSMNEIKNSKELPGYDSIKKYFNNLYLKDIWKEVLSNENNI